MEKIGSLQSFAQQRPFSILPFSTGGKFLVGESAVTLDLSKFMEDISETKQGVDRHHPEQENRGTGQVEELSPGEPVGRGGTHWVEESPGESGPSGKRYPPLLARSAV